MPILWRYLLKEYFKVFFLCIGAFLSVLIVMRAQEISRFASIDLNLYKIVLFTFYQLPFILPFAIPISGLIAATLLSQHLSQSHELTSLRASGASLLTALTPIILISCFFCLLNFIIISELTPICKIKSKSLLYDTIAKNPLLLLKKKKFIKIKNTHIDMRFDDNPCKAHDLLFAFLDPSTQSLSLMIAKDLSLDASLFKGENLSMISSLKEDKGFGALMIENQKAMSIDAKKFSLLLKRPQKTLSYEDLSTKQCLIKLKKSAKNERKKGKFELYKRLFFTLLPFTFVFLGLSFGISIGRNTHKIHLKSLIFLVLFLFICFFLGKACHRSPFLSLVFYILPHPFIIILSLYTQRKLTQGIE